MDIKLTRKERLAASEEKLRLAKEEVFKIIKPVIDAADPEQLLKMGCPADEYDSVCRRIAGGIIRERPMDVEWLSHLLTFCWHYSFSMWGAKVRYHESFTQIAEELYPLLPNEYRG